MIGDMNGFAKLEKIDLTDHGRCTGCGECCSNLLPLTEEEVSRIRRYVNENGIKEQRVNGYAVLADPVLDLTCPFLDPNKKDDRCLIYNIRPGICRAFKCSQTPYEFASESPWMFKGRRTVVNMREEFFYKK